MEPAARRGATQFWQTWAQLFHLKIVTSPVCSSWTRNLGKSYASVCKWWFSWVYVRSLFFSVPCSVAHWETFCWSTGRFPVSVLSLFFKSCFYWWKHDQGLLTECNSTTQHRNRDEAKHLFILIALKSNNPTVPWSFYPIQNPQSSSFQLWGYPAHTRGWSISSFEAIHFKNCPLLILCFCKIADCSGTSLFLQFYERVSVRTCSGLPLCKFFLCIKIEKKIILKVLLAYVSERRGFLHCRQTKRRS